MSNAETLRKAAALMNESDDDRWYPVADWLDREVHVGERMAQDFPHLPHTPDAAALAVARAYLGEDR